MVKQYSDMTNDERDARIVKLKDELCGIYECIVRRDGCFREKDPPKGWWDCRGSCRVQSAMRHLVNEGDWEWYSENEFFARPVEREVPTCQH